jgi:hypothetical protein
VRDEFVADCLIEVEEHKGHVLPDFFLDLAHPLGVILAVLDHPVVGIEAKLHLLEDLL